MHQASMRLMKAFLEKYGLKDDEVIVDVGALDINGSYKELMGTSEYWGTDIRPGKNVDFLIEDEMWKAMEGKVTAIICGQTLEHVKDPVLLMRQCHKLLKPGGIACFIVPTCGNPHYHPKFYGNYTIERMESILKEADCFEVLEMYLDEGPNTQGRVTVYLHDLFCVVLKCQTREE